MHGIIFTQLQKFVETNYDARTWHTLLKNADLSHKIYMPFKQYPDDDVFDIVAKASAATGISVESLLEAFGEFVVTDLVKVYSGFVKPEWKTLDLIENTEEMVHKVLRRKDPNAQPPTLSCFRENSHNLVVVYRSHRKMCAVAKGIIRGVGNYYKEMIHVEESECMLKGNDQCRIHVHLM